MQNFMKMLVTACAVVSLGTSLFAQAAPKAVPGAVLSVYTMTDTERPLPDAEPLAVVVDNSKSFSQSNLRKNQETEKFRSQHTFLVWNGYISIPAKGKYAFVMSFNDINNYHPENAILQINKKDFLTISTGRNSIPNASKSLQLEQGDYEVTVIYKNIRTNSSFELKMWNKANPLKKVFISPSAMVHAE